MTGKVLEQYVDRVYAYAVRRTFSREEAADLSQEILLTALKRLPSLRDSERFEPWLWGIAENAARSFRRRAGRERARFSYDLPELAGDGDLAEDIEREEEYAALRERVAMLSEAYRQTVILYYYEGLSTREIAERTGVAEGTVTWRLSEARRKLKKECTDMERSALTPTKLTLDIYGSGSYDGKSVPFPTAFIDDALSQNILVFCYDDARSIEEIAKHCGVPAYYVEDRVQNLLDREAVIEQKKGKYRTDFVIWSDKYGAYAEANAAKCVVPIADDMTAALKGIVSDAAGIGFYTAGRSEHDLFYLLGLVALMSAEHRSSLPAPEIAERYDGYRWRYIGSMESGKHSRPQLRAQGHVGRKYRYQTAGGFAGVPERGVLMLDRWMKACEEVIESGKASDAEAAAEAAAAGFIVRGADGALRVTIPVFSAEQFEQFKGIAEKRLAPVIERYCAAVETFVSGYRALFPAHLADDADRMCHGAFLGLSREVAEHARRVGAVGAPSADGFCDVMVALK